MKSPLCILLGLLGFVLLGACSKQEAVGEKRLVVGVAFETLQTEYWVAGYQAIREELKARDIDMLEAIADGDAARQLQQVKTFLARKVDGIILVPKDSKTCIPMVKAANAAGVPIVLFNRPPAPSDAQSVAVVADNRKLTEQTVAFMVGQVKALGRRHKAMIVLGDLGDPNSLARRDGFEDALKGHEDLIEVVARIPSEWNQEKAQSGVANALQANPDIRFIFTSSDFLLPSIVSSLKARGLFHPSGHPEHVILGGFDGDVTAYRLLKEGYLDATGVQDVYFEAQQSVQAILDLRAGKKREPLLLDPGFVITQANLAEKAERMWGARLAR